MHLCNACISVRLIVNGQCLLIQMVFCMVDRTGNAAVTVLQCTDFQRLFVCQSFPDSCGNSQAGFLVISRLKGLFCFDVCVVVCIATAALIVHYQAVAAGFQCITQRTNKISADAVAVATQCAGCVDLEVHQQHILATFTGNANHTQRGVCLGFVGNDRCFGLVGGGNAHISAVCFQIAADIADIFAFAVAAENTGDSLFIGNGCFGGL